MFGCRTASGIENNYHSIGWIHYEFMMERKLTLVQHTPCPSNYEEYNVRVFDVMEYNPFNASLKNSNDRTY